jgi:hypothetical protein
MTRYFCIDPSHRRDGGIRPVDVTTQVRLELGFLPRESAYLASSSDVIRRVRQLSVGSPGSAERDAEMRRILTGTTHPLDAPVVLVGDLPDGRGPGLYDLDDLRATAPGMSRTTASSQSGGSDDLIVISDEPHPSPRRRFSLSSSERQTAAVQHEARTEVVPQGMYPVLDLARRLADAPADVDAIVETIRRTPTYEGRREEHVGSPWRVVVECPEVEGDPPEYHRVVFTGTGDPEPLDVFGTPAAGWDVVLEDAATTDLAPDRATGRAESFLRGLLVVEVATAVALLVLTWLSGGLAMASRETPGWLGLAMVIGLAAVAIGAVALYAPAGADGNANDTIVLRRFYESRSQLLSTATAISGCLFAIALVAGIVPPMISTNETLPSPTVSFDATGSPVTTTVRLDVGGIGTDQTVAVEIRQYATATGAGTTIGFVTANGDRDGRVIVDETAALDRGAQYMSVRVTVDGVGPPDCSPTTAGAAGCTVLAVPPLGAGVVQNGRVVVTNGATATATVTGPTATPSP